MRDKALRSLMMFVLIFGLAGTIMAQGDSIAVGDTVTGTASGADVSYTISISSGETVVIAASSTDFDTLVKIADSGGNELANDDDSGGNLNSELTFTAPINDTFTITVTSFLGNPTGSFTLSVSGSSAGGDVGGDLQVGDTITDMAGDNTSYAIFLDSGQQVTITLESTDFDAFLEVQDSSGSTLATDDDSAGNLNAQLEFTAPSTDTYALVVRSFGGAASGEFTLSVVDASGGGSTGGMGDIAVGDTVTATATENMAYDIALDNGQTVTITLESADFDAFLEIQDNIGSTLATDDDSAGNLNAQLNFTAPSTGIYTLIVRSFGGAASGEFTLSVSGSSGGGGSTDGTTLQVGDNVTGTASGNVNYSLSLVNGQTVTITLVSADFDAFLEIQDSSGASLATDDDSAGDLDAQLTFTAPSEGTYTVIVRSFGGSASGSYTLSVEGTEAVAGQDVTIEYGQTLDVDPAGAVTTTIRFSATEGDVINLYAVSSGDEDSRLFLFDAAGTELIQDDDGGVSSNPFIRAFVIPETGEYRAELQGYGENPLNSPLAVTLERTELVELTAEGVVVTMGPETGDKDVLTTEVVAGTNYMFSVDTAADIESSLYVNLIQQGETFAATRFSVSGTSSFAGLFEADQTGSVRVEVEYYGYTSDVDFTLSIEPVK